MNTTAFETADKMKLPALLGLRNPDMVAKVLGFHHLYNVPVKPFGNTDNGFNHMPNARVALRLALVVEEFKELFKDGFGIDAQVLLSVKCPDGVYRCDASEGDGIEQALDRAELFGNYRNGVEVADASGDIVYVLIGMLIEMGYDLRPVIDEIHAANLTKLGADGLPLMREDGKVLKGPNYTAPNIAEALGIKVLPIYQNEDGN